MQPYIWPKSSKIARGSLQIYEFADCCELRNLVVFLNYASVDAIHGLEKEINLC